MYYNFNKNLIKQICCFINLAHRSLRSYERQGNDKSWYFVEQLAIEEDSEYKGYLCGICLYSKRIEV